MAQKKEQQQESGRGARESERGLVRRGPFGELSPWMGMSPFRRAFAELDWMFDQMQRSFFGGAPWIGERMGERMIERAPRLEVEETDNALVLRAEVPGVDPKDLQVEAREGLLTIRGETRREEGDEERRTSSYASYYRRVPLPPDVDVERAEASCRNGVLKIRLPLSEEGAGAKRIPITAESGQEKSQEKAA